jgi:ribose/xylose/arabinose/galactoside ABC-type transport system permease subunit
MLAISLLLGAISLLLESERDEDDDPVRLARGVSVLALFALGVLIVLSACGVDMSPRIPAIAAALFVVPALSLPALRAASPGR